MRNCNDQNKIIMMFIIAIVNSLNKKQKNNKVDKKITNIKIEI